MPECRGTGWRRAPDLWERYLFERHSCETLRRWCQRLKLFRYVRARGGHAGEEDVLTVVFAYESEARLVEFFRAVGVVPAVFSVCPPQPIPGQSYRGDEFAAFASLVPDTTWIEQPGYCVLLGVAVFLWCAQDRISITIHTEYDVTEHDVENAARLEPVLASLPFVRIDPPVEAKHCLCPQFYPHFFQ